MLEGLCYNVSECLLSECLRSQIQAILGQILTFPDPPVTRSNFHGLLNGLYWCLTYSTVLYVGHLYKPIWKFAQPLLVLHILCSNRTYWGILGPLKSVLALFQLLHGKVIFVAKPVRILTPSLEYCFSVIFSNIFCIKCVVLVNINYPKVGKHQYISGSQPRYQIVSNYQRPWHNEMSDFHNLSVLADSYALNHNVCHRYDLDFRGDRDPFWPTLRQLCGSIWIFLIWKTNVLHLKTDRG